MKNGDNRARVRALDGLRGIAALMVFFHHTLHIPAGGYLGVDLFFVLSGYLISSLLVAELAVRRIPNFRRFYRKRVLRLLPAFALMVVFYMAIRFCFSPEQPAVGPRRFIEILFLSDFNRVVPFLTHCWSLSVEWQFYFLWPVILTSLLVSGLRRRHVATLVLAAVAAVWIARIRFGVDIRIDGLLLGSALALVPVASGLSSHMPRAIRHGILGVALFAAVALMFVSDYGGAWIAPWLGYALEPILAVCMLSMLGEDSGAAGALLASVPLVYFGRISYGFYLYHFPVAALMYINGYPPLASAIVGLIVCVPLSDCSFRYVEQPILRSAWALRDRDPVVGCRQRG